MDVLERVAKDICEGYGRVYRERSPLPPVCLYHPVTMNGSFDTLGELVRAGLCSQGLGVPAVTLSRADVPLPNHYSVDVDWFMNRFEAIA